MASMSDAFIAMPGGFGTYEEFFEAVTWTQLGVHKKPCGLLNVAGFYDPVVQFLDRAVDRAVHPPAAPRRHPGRDRSGPAARRAGRPVCRTCRSGLGWRRPDQRRNLTSHLAPIRRPSPHPSASLIYHLKHGNVPACSARRVLAVLLAARRRSWRRPPRPRRSCAVFRPRSRRSSRATASGRQHRARGAAGGAARRVPRPVEQAAGSRRSSRPSSPSTRRPASRSTSWCSREAEDFKQEGLPEPLLVFEREFVIGVRLALAAGLPPGDLAVPARLRYQACDDKMCYAPSNAQTPVDAEGGRRQRDGVRRSTPTCSAPSPSGPARSPAAARRPLPRRPAPARQRAVRTPASRGSTQFTVVASTGGYLGTDDFLTFIKNAESGVVEKGLFEGQGPIAILLIVLLGGLALNLTPCVLPMIPINLAIIGAGAQAGVAAARVPARPHLRRRDGVRLRRARPDRRAHGQHLRHHQRVAVVQPRHRGAVRRAGAGDVRRVRDRLLALLRTASGSGAGRGTFLLAFTMGTVAALLAGACVAPVVIQVVLFASNLYATGTTIALALAVLPRHRHGACRGPSPARASPRSPSPAPGWCASSRPSAC